MRGEKPDSDTSSNATLTISPLPTPHSPTPPAPPAAPARVRRGRGHLLRNQWRAPERYRGPPQTVCLSAPASRRLVTRAVLWPSACPPDLFNRGEASLRP